MKIIKRTSDNVVVYAGDSLTLDATHATNGDWSDPATNATNAVLISDVTLPADYSGGTYTFDGATWAHTAAGAEALTESLKTVRAEKWEAIKAHRDNQRFEGGVKVGNLWFLSTAIAQNEYTTLLLVSVGLPATYVLRAAWRTMSGATIDMTPTLAKQILMNGLSNVAAIDDAAQAHRAAMEASADPAAYDFSGGWPAIYVVV